jgi:hypothetical protein
MNITRSSLHTAKGPRRLVHRRRLHRHCRGPRGRRARRLVALALHPRCPHRLAHPPLRPEHLRHRGRGPVPERGRPNRDHPPWRPRLLRGRREPYFAAIALIVGSGASNAGKLVLLVLYCVIYTLPLIVIAIVVAVLGDHAERVLRPAGDWLTAHWPLVVGPITGAFGAGVLLFGITHLT